MKRAIRSPKAIFATVILLAGVGCNRGGQQQTAQMERPPTSVTAVEAIARDVPVYLDEIGRCVSPEVVTVTPQISGRITEISLVEGAEVNKGDTLVTIDPRPFKAELAKADAAVAQNKAGLEMAHLEFDRAKKLQGSNAISPEEYDTKRLAVDVNAAQIEAAQAAVETAQLNLEYCTIKSPLAGRSGQQWVDVGNVVKANETALLTVQQLDPIYSEFTITENDLGTVRKYMATSGIDFGKHPEQGLKVFVDVPGDSKAVLAALGAPKPATEPSKNRGGPREGMLTFLDNSVQDQTGTVKLRATLTNPDHYFWPGQFVNIRLVLTTQKDAILIPAEAQQLGQQGPFVYVVKADNTAEMRPITMGQRQGELFVVERGLSAGEKVITTGQMMIMPGAKVQIQAPVTPQAQGPSDAAKSGGKS